MAKETAFPIKPMREMRRKKAKTFAGMWPDLNRESSSAASMSLPLFFELTLENVHVGVGGGDRDDVGVVGFVLGDR